MKFTEAELEKAIITLLEQQGFPHTPGNAPDLPAREPEEVLLKDDLRSFLTRCYAQDQLTNNEISSIIRQLETYPAADLYSSNKQIHKLVTDGFLFKREDHRQKDLYIQLIDYSGLPEQRQPRPEELVHIIAENAPDYRNNSSNSSDMNCYRLVNQLTIEGRETRIPDAILYINGLPLVVFEFKSAIREEATIHDAYKQLTIRYRRDIPELMKYNALCIISDGVNSRLGSLFAAYEHFSAWRKVTGHETQAQDGISSLHTLLQGLFDKERLRLVLRHFIFFPDASKEEVKVVCRYPQFYATVKLFDNIKIHRKPQGDGKGGTYFGTTGCGKSFTMLFLSRILMKSVDFASPTIILITDRTDLDNQLAGQFSKAKDYIGDQIVVSVESRDQLRHLLKDRSSGGVFLTTIHKFSEDTQLLSTRNNIICISDEAHRSQLNLDQKLVLNQDKGRVRRCYGFAKYLHDSLPNATYVGFTGTPIDATLDVFGPVVDAYTMTESVRDEITVRIVYEGRAAKILLDNAKLEEIEKYYACCAEQGANDHQIDASKKATAQMTAILGDPDRLKALAADFVAHYERRLEEGSTVKGKALFVCSKREIAHALWQELIALRPAWNKVLASEICESGTPPLTTQEEKRLEKKDKPKPIQRVKMIMTRGKDDPKELYDLLGSKEERKALAHQFKNPMSNFKIALVVDMWLTGFDVPFLDSIYIDKPIQRHNLIQTISRVNRRFEGKEKGLAVDYIGIKKQMNQALAQYNRADQENIEEISQSLIVVRDHLDLLNRIFHRFDAQPCLSASLKDTPVEQLNCLNRAADHAMRTNTIEKRYMALVKRLKAAYDICCGAEELSQQERDQVHFYLAVRSIIFKLNKGDAPDTAQMNAKVRTMIAEALQANGVEEIFKLGEEQADIVDLFTDDYQARLEKIKLPHTKIKLLQQLLAKAIDDFKKINRSQGLNFSKKFKALVDRYNERKEEDSLESMEGMRGNVLEDFTNEIMALLQALKKERESCTDLGINLEEKAFYDTLKGLAQRYQFAYPEEKLLALSKAVKAVVDDKSKYTDWNQRDDIKAELKVDLIILLAEHGYPPVDQDEVYQEIFAQAENFKKHRLASQ